MTTMNSTYIQQLIKAAKEYEEIQKVIKAARPHADVEYASGYADGMSDALTYILTGVESQRIVFKVILTLMPSDDPV